MAVKALSVLTLQFLELARDALFQGDMANAAELGWAALARTTRAKDNDLSAQSLLLLARVYIAQSQMTRGYQYAQESAHLFKGLSNLNGYADALALATLAATALRSPALPRVSAALLAALDAGGLMERVMGTGYNHLGVSAMWNGRYKESAFALMLAHDSADGVRGDADFQPRINLFMLEVLKVVEWERTAQTHVDYSTIVGMASICERAKRKWYGEPIPRSTRDVGMLLLDFANCFTAVRTSDMPKAHTHYEKSVLRVIPMPTSSWQVSLALWAKAEIARGINDLQSARSAFVSMQHAARLGEHRPLERLARDMQLDMERALVR